VIVGIGADLCDVRRIEKTLARFGGRFERRVFTETEQARANRRPDKAATYAKRFAAKEAVSKALGSGIRMGVTWREMAVANLPSGQPTMTLSGGAAARLARMVPEGHAPAIHLTMTDDRPYAQAFVVIEALPKA